MSTVEAGLISKVYDAAYDSDAWADYFEALRAATGASSAVLIGCDFAGGNPDAANFGHVYGSDDVYAKYRDYYWRVDAFYAAGRGNAWPGRVHCTSQVISDRDLAGSEFGNDFLLPHDMFYFSGSMLFASEATLVWCGAMRSRRQGPPDDRELRLHGALLPHLQQALRIDSRMRQLRVSRAATGDVIDMLPFGLVGLDASGRVLFLNRQAENIVVAAAGLRLGPAGLAALRPQDDSRLQAAIGLAVAASPTGSTVVLPRPAGRPLGVVVAPVQRNRVPLPALHPAPAALLFLHDPDRRVEPPVKLLRALYGLTPKEAQLAVELARGCSVAEAAEKLQITRKTGANHLRQIFRKMAVTRQSELVRLVVALPTVGRLDEA